VYDLVYMWSVPIYRVRVRVRVTACYDIKFSTVIKLDITEYVFCRNDHFRAKYRICEMEGEGTLDGGDVLFTGTS